MYQYDANVWCDDCGKAICERLDAEGKRPEDPTDESSFDSDDYPKFFANDDESRSDSPSHCGSGGHCLDYITLSNGDKVGAIIGGLTKDGEKYVIERATEKDSNGRMRETVSPCVALWIEYFDIKLPTLDSNTGIGCYPIVYYNKDGECFCGQCAAQERGKGNKVMADIPWEGPDLECCDCYKKIETAYGGEED